MRAQWKQRAYICRFGHQSIYDLLGRDPLKSPLTNIELALFQQGLHELLTAEYSTPEKQLHLHHED